MSFLQTLFGALGLGAAPKKPRPQQPSSPPPPPRPKETGPDLDAFGVLRSDAYDYSYGNLQSFAGLPVKLFERPGDISDFSTVAPKVEVEWEGEKDIVEFTQILLAQPGIDQCRALVFGPWHRDVDEGPQELIDFLVANRQGLPALRAVFFGDIVSEQNEMSWIVQGDYSAFWQAFPDLEVFWARGGGSLKLGPIKHANLRSLVIQTGGMDRETVREALAAEAPLEHLELWLGDDGYGANTSVDDLAPLLAGGLFPNLKTLGLCNSQLVNELAAALAASPLLGRLETLDLSKGVLQDRGGEALAAGAGLASLKTLVIAHHYMSNSVVAALKAIVPTVIQSTRDPEKADSWDNEQYYNIAVAE